MNVIRSEIEYFQKNPFQRVIHILLIAGAINWGLIAYNGTDFVQKLAVMVGYIPLDRYVKIAVGLAGVFMLYKLILRSSQRLQDIKK